MMSAEVQEAIVKNIQGFDDREKRQFRMHLVEEAFCDEDLVDMISVKGMGDYWNLDTAVRDNYMDAYLKMHISEL